MRSVKYAVTCRSTGWASARRFDHPAEAEDYADWLEGEAPDDPYPLEVIEIKEY